MKKSLCKIRFSTLILTILTFTFLFVPLALAKKPIGGGNGNGGKPTPESGVNNLSYPVIWAEGVTKALPGTPGMDPVLTGQWWYQWGANGTDPDITPASCPPDPDESDPYLNPEGLPFCDDGQPGVLTLLAGEPEAEVPLPLAKAFIQKDSFNVWQAGSATPMDAGVAELDGELYVDWIDWGDNLESVDWYTRSQVRTEVVLFQDNPDPDFVPTSEYSPWLEYSMRHTSGWGIDEVHGMAAQDYWYRLSEPYDEYTTYQEGDIVIYDAGEGDAFYIAKLYNPAPSTPPNSEGKWDLFVADPFNSGTSYSTDAYIEYNGNIYLATADNPSTLENPAVSPDDQPVATIGPGTRATVYSHCARLTIQKLLLERQEIPDGALKWVPGEGWVESYEDYPPFDSMTQYHTDDIVIYDGQVFAAGDDIPFTSVAPPDDTYWEVVSEFVAGTSYSAGDFVIHEDKIYQAIEDDVSTAPPNTTYWKEVAADSFDAGTSYSVANLVGYGEEIYLIYKAIAPNPTTSASPGEDPWVKQYDAVDLINDHIFNGSVHEGGDGPGYYSAEINVKGRIIFGYTWNVRNLHDLAIVPPYTEPTAAGDYRLTFSLDEACGTAELNTYFVEGVTEIIVPLEEEVAAAAAEEGESPGGGANGVLVPAVFDIDRKLISGNLTYMDIRILERGGGGNGGGGSKGGGSSH
jgi:hypothetical protein